MQTLTIHQVTSIQINETEHYPSDKQGNAFNTRRIKVEDITGSIFEIVLFADDAKALTMNADWNQGQSITL